MLINFLFIYFIDKYYRKNQTTNVMALYLFDSMKNFSLFSTFLKTFLK